MFDTAARLIMNRNEFSNETGALYRTDDLTSDKLAAGSQLVWNNMAPGFMGRPVSKLLSAVSEKPYGSRGKMMSYADALSDGLLGIREVSLKEPNTEALLEYEMNAASSPQTPSDRYYKNYDPEAWESSVDERTERALERFEEKQRQKNELLRQQFNRMDRLRKGIGMLKYLGGVE